MWVRVSGLLGMAEINYQCVVEDFAREANGLGVGID